MLDITDITGVGKITAKKLVLRGFKTVQDIAEAGVANISVVTGFPTGRSEAIQKAAGMLLEQNISDQRTIASEPNIEPDSTQDGKKKKKDGKKKKKKKKDGKKKKK